MEEKFASLAGAYLHDTDAGSTYLNNICSPFSGSVDDLLKVNQPLHDGIGFLEDTQIPNALPTLVSESLTFDSFISTPLELEALGQVKVPKDHYNTEDFLTGETPLSSAQADQDILTAGGRHYVQGFKVGFKQGFESGLSHGLRSISPHYEAWIDEKNREIERLGKMVHDNSTNYDLRGAKIGNISNINNGSMFAKIEENIDEISQIMNSLKYIASSFPTQQKGDVLDELEALENDIKMPGKQDESRISRRLKRLVTAGAAAATFVSGASTFAGNINDFFGAVQDLGEKFGVVTNENE